MDLPIDVVPNSRPPKFRWRSRMDTLVGPRVVEYETTMPANVEGAVADLIALAKMQAREIEALKLAQSELLSKKAEAPTKKGK